jgi:SAM-dependent methyltransferase
MAQPGEPTLDTEELMARVRATLGRPDAATDAEPPAPVVLSPHFHQEQLLLDQAQRVVSVGVTVPPFGGLNRLLRPLARLTTRALYAVLQVITVDQRVFNALLLNVTRMTSAGLAQGEAALNERLLRRAAAGAEREARTEGLERRIDELRAALTERDARLATAEERLLCAEERLVSAEERLVSAEERLDGANAALSARLTSTGAKLDEHDSRVSALDSRAGLAESGLHELSDAARRAAQRLDLGDGALQELRRKIAAAQAGITAQERRLVNLGEATSRPRSRPRPDGETTAHALIDEAAHALDALYVDFEEEFRGSPADIKSRLQVYVADVRGVLGDSDGQVLDLGCGRGEWLSLLGEEGLHARGVDSNRVQIERCRAQGLEVVEADFFDVLRALPEASADVLTAFHLAEHLPYARLVELLDEAVRALRPGGLLILETPNPDNVLVGSCQFYLDPTHRHPLPSALLRFLVEARGLRDVEVRLLHPAPDYERLQGSEVAERLNQYLYGPRDYAVLGYKA